jgi:serine/threonine protein kinase
LNIDVMNDAAIARFEHEVQITSQLNHPNTIAIYDYGRTPEGVFYYAMEFLDGIDLQELVAQYGPQPEARVIQIMLQICGSLYEAHAQGLVHRDIKPANVMINRRGGQPDVVKVLDFGLVKQVDATSKDNSLAGTPLYMSPEAIQSPSLVDACSDLYALGAVGYFLITGKSVFDATNVVELLQKHVTESPQPPSQRMSISITQEFEDVLLSCLEKSRSRRPQTARDLAQMLIRCQTAGKWTVLEAEAWWANHDRRYRSVNGGSTVVNSSFMSTQATARTLNSPTQTSKGDPQRSATTKSSNASSNPSPLDQTVCLPSSLGPEND